MKLPTIEGVIDRRVLVNYRVEPRTMAALLPSSLRPQVVDGWAIAGICLIRLQELRPAGMPPWIGLRSENAAHRVAVEWDEDGAVRTGVFIPRRDSNSRTNTLFGGRLFPGVHHHARFQVSETEDVVDVRMRSKDAAVSVAVRGRRSTRMPGGSVFGTVQQASAFFEGGALGLSPTRSGDLLEALELDVPNWRVDPLEIEDVHSSFFSDTTRFPQGTVQIDHALLMRGIRHRWHQREPVCGCEELPRRPDPTSASPRVSMV
jgi:hypothetical protein